MKLSIWQQFSSNHSSHYTVVGRFDNPAYAAQIADRFRQILKSIATWQRDPTNEAWQREHSVDKVRGYVPIPPEQDIARQYQVDWGEAHIDWIADNPDKNVVLLDNDVFVSVDFETWEMPTPIVNLMKTFGGQLFLQDQDTQLTVDLAAHFPDTTQARQAYEQIEASTARNRTIQIQPQTIWQRWFALLGYRKSPKKRPYKPVPPPPWYDPQNAFSFFHLSDPAKLDGSTISYAGQFFRLDRDLLRFVQWLKDNGAAEVSYAFSEGVNLEK